VWGLSPEEREVIGAIPICSTIFYLKKLNIIERGMNDGKLSGKI
jgi:hypothetical protein